MSTEQTLAELRRATGELCKAFERAEGLPRVELADALRDASAVLIELRRTTDALAQKVRP